jgi:hypothetical protein
MYDQQTFSSANINFLKHLSATTQKSFLNAQKYRGGVAEI